MDKVSIVILNYNRWDLTHQLLFSIYQTCTAPDEVVVVNNGCTQEESFTGLQWWRETQMLPVRELRIENNIGFLRAANEGMKESTGDIIILISNDVIVKSDIVLRIQHQLKTTYKSLIGGRVLDYSTGWNDFDGIIFPYVEGYLLATWKDNWKELGYFDELYVPNDFEDVDLSTTAKSLEYILVGLPDDAAQHLSGQTLGYNLEREARTKINREKFKNKWLN